MSFILKSYAKINLFFDVLERLENGYHNIITLYSEVNIYDTLKFSLTKNNEFKIIANIQDLNNQDNLIFQIGVYIKDRYSVQCGAKIELKKNIPIAAGLGGGSSNGAATIKGLSHLWGLNIPPAERHAIASQFGSDLNFFLEGYLAKGTNRGEIIESIDHDLYCQNLLLVNPLFPITSKEAYQLIDLTTLRARDECEASLQLILQQKDFRFCYNRLEAGICQKYPALQKLLHLLKEFGAVQSIVSGSGATCIGFFNNPLSCSKAKKKMDQLNYWSQITSTRRRQKT